MKLPNNGASSIGGENLTPMDDASLAPEDGNMEEPMPMDDMPMDNMPMDSDIPEGDNGMGDDETMNIINKLSPKDKEAVKSYAESLTSNDEDSNESEQQEGPMQDGLNMEAPMNETFIFKKSQLNKLMENFGPTNDELVDNKKTNLSKKQKNVKNSPFNAPDFE